ncbi:hypothetical protein Rhe02_85170 [Rhizocola hellebori]|uniref:DUF4190 domain-containing protein n=1 Tax=Rhizocola hellebori TaxID=1392758 RepID=A0A8J3VL39_9ACTN|nr:hypothetical protein Rhe02_85170 [Rhizocola hellebori]
MSDQTPPPAMQNWTPPPAAYGYGYPVVKPTNGMAIGAMVTSLVALMGVCFYGVGGIIAGPVGAILGHVARRQVRERNQQGEGMAMAGIIVGWIATALGALVVIGLVIFFIWVGNQPDPNF